MARYYRTDTRRNAPTSTEITGYTASALVYLNASTGDPKYLDAAVETARYEELLARPELHEVHDVVSLRAVRVESRVLNSLQAFLAPDGILMLFRGPSGPQMPGILVPPLEFTGTYPLVESLRSRLTVLTKRHVGPVFHVEHPAGP